MSDKFNSQYVTVTTPICKTCEYRDEESPFRCLAYPKGIPQEITLGTVDHTKPHKGDHGLQYKLKGSK